MSPGSLPIHCFETFTYDIRPCITQGMKIISGSSWSARVFLPLSMHLSLPFPHVPSLLFIFYQTAILRSAWTFPVDFPSTWPGTPPGTPPETPPRTPPWRSPRTPPGTPRLHRLVCFTAGAAAAFACTLHTRRCVRRVEPGDAER